MLTISAHGATYSMHPVGGKAEQCWRRGVPYEQPLLEHVYAQGFTGTAVDAGAGVGNHSLWFALVCGMDVVAFEPIRHEVITRHAELNGAEHLIRVEPVALGDRDGSAAHVAKGRLAPGEVSQYGLVRNGAGQTPSPGGNVPVRRLDDYRVNGVSVIKADVEGMEPAMLRGGEQTIKRDWPVIYAETWGDGEHDAIAAVLEPWGYRAGESFNSPESTTPVVCWQPT